jgi:hypothetical protein
MQMITGKTLIDWGFKPSDRFKPMVAAANQLRSEGKNDDAIFAALEAMVPIEQALRTNALPFGFFLDAHTEIERDNAAAVAAHMDVLMRTPTIVAGAVMPDACPSGQQAGTIPVGGAVACADAIHPGFHSADICCSVAISVFRRKSDPKQLLDAVQAVTHFGPGGRDRIIQPPADIMAAIAGNRYLDGLQNFAVGHFASQGDGNHFAYVGHMNSTGELALVTHHGSRGFGAQLYKRGMADAKRHTAIHAPKVPAHNSWLKASSADGEAYWAALQIVRAWTKANHFAIHDLAAHTIGNAVEGRFWNEHNFVFQKSDGLFYHGKGATPSWSGFADDDSGGALIPLNMAEPILLVEHRDKKESLGFAPHGAGRNMSRTQHMKHGDLGEELGELQSAGLDIRSYCGIPDLSELPSAYKSASAVRVQIEKYGLAEVVDTIDPYGSIMAGDWQRDAPWRKKK